MDKMNRYLPGIFICVIIGIVSSYLGGQIPLVGGPVLLFYWVLC